MDKPRPHQSSDFTNQLRVTDPSVDVFSGGCCLNDFGPLGHMANSKMLRLFTQMVEGHHPVFVFDIDGTLIEGGLEVGSKRHRTVDQYLSDNKEAFLKFRELLGTFKARYKAEVVICTGRGREFANRISQLLFGEGLVDKIISEGGGMIHNRNGDRLISDIEPHMLELTRHKKPLIDYVTHTLGGTFETGKDICISFNPPRDMEMPAFRSQIETFLTESGADMSHIYVTNSDSAVDINPFGIDKLAAMRSQVREGIVVYFGDADNDRTAMEGFAHVSIAPSNAHEKLRDEVVKLSGSQENSRSFMGVLAKGSDIYGANQGLSHMLSLYEGLSGTQLVSLLSAHNRGSVRSILSFELFDDFSTQQRLMLSHGDVDTGNLYDKIFFKAETIITDPNGDVEVVIHSSKGFVRFNDQTRAPSDINTVSELREGKAEGVLFSGVAAIRIHTDEGVRIPLLKRDAGAYVDANKFTLPAGRADKSPGQTALEELIEEMVIFGERDGQRCQIVPYLPDVIPEDKVRRLAEVARGKYLISLLENGHSTEDILGFMDLQMSFIPLQIPDRGGNVTTRYTHDGDLHIKESGIYAYHDTGVNTWEMIRAFELDLNGFTQLVFADGDGFGREISLLSPEEVEAMSPEDQVNSLRNAISLGVFSSQ